VRSRRLLLGGILPAAILVIAGCSSTATAAPGSSTAPGASNAPAASNGLPFGLPSGLFGGNTTGLDPSTVLTPDVAGSIIGGTATLTPGSISTGPISILSYSNASSDDVTILIETLPGGIQQTIMQAALAQAGASGELTPITGLGDTAGKNVGDHDATIGFAKGDTIVILTATSAASAGTDIDAKLEALAQQIAGKL
jgi:hypothetical protein